MKSSKQKLLLLAILTLIPFVAKANIVWPSIYIVSQYYTWYVIAIGLVIEIATVKLFLKPRWIKAFIIATVSNIISALFGIPLIPISGFIGEFILLPFTSATFHLSHWIFDYLLVVICNTLVEDLTIKLIFKYPFKKNFWWLFVANAISVIICAFVPLPKM